MNVSASIVCWTDNPRKGQQCSFIRLYFLIAEVHDNSGCCIITWLAGKQIYRKACHAIMSAILSSK